jgi:hypothetical protein
MKTLTLFIVGFATVIVPFVGCKDTFSPKGPFENQLVVYSVLQTSRDLQYVRVYTSYDVSGFDPFESAIDHPIAGARVVITGPGGTYVFRDTLLPRQDKSRYSTSIAAYVANLRPKPGETYTLDVRAENIGSTIAAVTTPRPSTLLYWYPNTTILDDPGSVKDYASFYAYGRLLEQTKAYTYQFAIEYDVLLPEGWQRQSVEPVLASVYKSYGGGSGSCSKSVYMSTLSNIESRYGNTKLIFRRIVYRLLQLEENWYNYYNTVRKFQDPFSIRLDEPDFTNLSNGYGLFGASTLDSLVHDYPDDFKYNHR